METITGNKMTYGYRVVGPNNFDGESHGWAFPTKKLAEQFARFMCADTLGDYEVLKFVSIFTADVPVKRIDNTDKKPKKPKRAKRETGDEDVAIEI